MEGAGNPTGAAPHRPLIESRSTRFFALQCRNDFTHAQEHFN
jgi:hypothetical protein